MEKTKKDSCVYCCYSPPMHRFMADKGIDSIIKAMNIKTKNIFWVYEKNEEFKSALREWTLMGIE